MGYEPTDDDDMEEADSEDDDDLEQFKSKSKKARGGVADTDESEEEGIAAWGSSRKDFYNADQIETEADAFEEEEEAKRLQQKHLQEIDEGDYGFDETEWAESNKPADRETTETGVVTEVLPQLKITEDMSTEEKTKILKSKYPEFEPLAQDFVDLQPTCRALGKAAKIASPSAITQTDSDYAPVDVIKYRALSAYLGAISMYFLLLTSAHDSSDHTATLSPAQLRAHPVMTSLVKFRKLWNAVKDMTPVETIPEPESMEEFESDIEVETPKPTRTETKASKKDKKKPFKKQRAAEAAQAEAEDRRAKRLEETEANLASLSTLVTEPGRKRATQKAKSASKDADHSDFGDEDALTTKEAEEKAKQKRSLRFYTSQIAQKSNKRNAAGRDAGGDTDIPHRERLRDRQARLNLEAEKRGMQRPQGAEELGGESDDEDRRVARDLRGEGGQGSGSDDDDYYDMIAARSSKRKSDKKALAEAQAAAAREGGHVHIQEEVGPDGKRAITYQIEKNKGLAPKRNKLNRNPRVKKRMRFEEKKKKLGSIRQVYKGGESRGGYGGELTGIKKNLVKSVKL